MRQYLRPGPIDRLSLEARIVYTAFLALLLVGYATSAWLYLDDGMGLGSRGVTRYYLGDEAVSVPAEPAGGPAVELPGEDIAPVGMRMEKPRRQVMEVFHFHLFSVSVCLLVIGHLFMMCALSTRLKAWVLALSSVATLVHLLAPPLIAWGGASLSFLMGPSAVLMALGWMVMTVLPLWEMWRAPLPPPPGPLL